MTEADLGQQDLGQQLEGTDGADPEWPLWYADYLRDGLAPLLDASFTKSELVYLLVMVANEQPLTAPGANWARYYAKFFIRLYT